jgi:transcriptional regulator with XRE-family HTH domain
MAKAKFSPVYKRLCRLLVDARKKAKLQQTDVAKRIGRPQSYVSKVESGERRLDVAEFIELAAAIDADPVAVLKKAIVLRN